MRVTSALLPLLVAGVATAGLAGLPQATGAPSVTATVGSSGQMPVPAADDARTTFSVVLSRRESAARKHLKAVSDPRSPRYRTFLTRSQIRSRYGADPHDVRTVRRSARAAGLTTVTDRTGLFMRVSGRVKDLEPWLGQQVEVIRETIPFDSRSLQQEEIFLLGDTTAPPDVADAVRTVIPFWVKLRTYSAVSTARVRPVAPNLGTYVGGCRAARRQNTYSFAQLAHAYGVDRLPATQRVGRASRLAILASGEGFSRRSLRHSARCFDVPGRHFTRVHAPGMVGNLPEAEEGDLDTQVAQAVLPPGSRISVIESPERGGTFYLAWAAAFGLPRLPDAVSQSYGLCERVLGEEFLIPASRHLLDSILVRLGLAGTTATSSAGDDGSSDCYEQDQTTPPAVDYPTSSPFITSVGGSQIVLRRSNERRTERVWRDVDRTMVLDGRTVPTPTSGGGGGRSTIYGRPWFQRHTGVATTRRTTPDVAMHASFGPAWPVYLSRAAAGQVNLPSAGFYAIAGTSASSPYFASSVALLASSRRHEGQPPFGHLAPALYDIGRRHPGALYDITRGTNDLYDVGCCAAGPGYDMASGMGAPDFGTFPRWITPPGGRRPAGRG